MQDAKINSTEFCFFGDGIYCLSKERRKNNIVIILSAKYIVERVNTRGQLDDEVYIFLRFLRFLIPPFVSFPFVSFVVSLPLIIRPANR